MSENCLIIFVKNPELGKVKTRLARTLGDEAALDIYKKLLHHTHTITHGLSCDKKLYFSNHIEKLEGWSEDYEPMVQSDGDLGEKMKSAFQTELSHYQKICIIGSDCAELRKIIIEAAFSALDQYDAVLGPANDGGYYLLGLKQMQASLFDDMPWSTDRVLTETKTRLQKSNLTIHLLPELIDVDTAEDWEQVKSQF